MPENRLSVVSHPAACFRLEEQLIPQQEAMKHKAIIPFFIFAFSLLSHKDLP